SNTSSKIRAPSTKLSLSEAIFGASNSDQRSSVSRRSRGSSSQQRKRAHSSSKERNKLQHFGSTSSREVVTALAAKALDVLSEFIQTHLVPDAPEEEAEHLKEAEHLIRTALTSIEPVIKARLDRIRPKLNDWQGPVIHCPKCAQLALPFEPSHEEYHCQFCRFDWNEVDGTQVADEYVGSILGETLHEAIQGKGGWSVDDCPECKYDALVSVATRENPDSYLTDVCFHCGFIASGPLGTCGRCGHTTSDTDDVICSDCLDDLLAED
ncbi:hypothetical protein ACFQV8_00005, partial [Pseudonocardia benzenivorans]